MPNCRVEERNVCSGLTIACAFSIPDEHQRRIRPRSLIRPEEFPRWQQRVEQVAHCLTKEDRSALAHSICISGSQPRPRTVCVLCGVWAHGRTSARATDRVGRGGWAPGLFLRSCGSHRFDLLATHTVEDPTRNSQAGQCDSVWRKERLDAHHT